MKLASGGNLIQAIKKLTPGDFIELEAGGTYAGGDVPRTLVPIRIVGNGAVLRPNHQGEGDGLAFYKNGPVEVLNLVCSDNKGYGISVIQCASLHLQGVTAERNGIMGILTSNTSDVLIEQCFCNQNGEQHGIYCSQSGDRLQLIGNVCTRNGRAGIQVNAVAGHPKADPNWDSISRDVLVQGNKLVGNQGGKSGGGAALNFAGCTQLVIRNNKIVNHRGSHGISLFDDGAGAPFACHDVLIDGNTFGFAPGKGQSCINVKAGCSDVRVGAGNIFPPHLLDVETDKGVSVTRVQVSP